MNEELKKRLRQIIPSFRNAEKLVVSELNISNYNHDDVVKTDKSLTDFYHAVEDIRSDIQRILDDIDQGKFE